jgi:hypothetical protein
MRWLLLGIVLYVGMVLYIRFVLTAQHAISAMGRRARGCRGVAAAAAARSGGVRWRGRECRGAGWCTCGEWRGAGEWRHRGWAAGGCRGSAAGAHEADRAHAPRRQDPGHRHDRDLFLMVGSRPSDRRSWSGGAPETRRPGRGRARALVVVPGETRRPRAGRVRGSSVWVVPGRPGDKERVGRGARRSGGARETKRQRGSGAALVGRVLGDQKTGRPGPPARWSGGARGDQVEGRAAPPGAKPHGWQ